MKSLWLYLLRMFLTNYFNNWSVRKNRTVKIISFRWEIEENYNELKQLVKLYIKNINKAEKILWKKALDLYNKCILYEKM